MYNNLRPNTNKTNIKRLIILFLYSICIGVYSNVKAQNLIENYSFEKFIDFSNNNNSNWHKVQKSDTPDYFNLSTDAPHNSIFKKYMGNVSPKSGDGFVGIFCYRVSSIRGIKNIREFIESPLLHTMEKDSMYKIELSLRLDIESNLAIKNIGIHFSNELCSQDRKFKPLFVKPQVEFNSVLLDSTSNWITLQALYKANGSEKNIIIGNFRSDRKTFKKDIFFRKEKKKRYKWDLVDNEKAAYYYIDDVIVQKVHLPQKLTAKIEEDDHTLALDSLFNINEIEADSAIILKNIVFEFNKSDLLPQSYTELNKLKQLMEANPDIRIKLEGHTDDVGGYDFNLKLSIKRVEAVTAYLVNKGINPSRIEYAGYSYSKPLTSNATEEGRQTNRRVAFKILKK